MRTLGFISLVAASGHHRTRPKEVRGPKPPYSSQLWWMSTCFIAVCSFGASFVSIRIVCKLSQYMVGSSYKSNLMLVKNRFHQMKFFAVCDSASSSASVDDVITIVPLTAL